MKSAALVGSVICGLITIVALLAGALVVIEVVFEATPPVDLFGGKPPSAMLFWLAAAVFSFVGLGLSTLAENRKENSP